MLKKGLVALVLMIALDSSYAAQNGWYVGGTLGRDSGSMKQHEGLDNNTLLISNYSFHLADNIVGVHVGYNQFFTKQFMLGGEISANHSGYTLSINKQPANTMADFKKTNSVSISLLPGWQLNDRNRLYSRIGWIQTTFEGEHTSPSTLWPVFKENTPGLELGVGWAVSLTNNLALTLEYDHANYKVIVKSPDDDHWRFKPDFDQFLAGINYYFNPSAADNDLPTLKPVNDGFYLGANAGRNNVEMSQQQTAAITQQFSLRGDIGGLQAGYRWQLLPQFNLATEIFYSISSSYNSTSILLPPLPSADVRFKLREKSSTGFSILPGYNITTTSLVYARIGLINSKFENKNTTTNRSPFSTNRNGLQLGLGYQAAITKHWHIFGEYDHASYAKIYTSRSVNRFYYVPQDNQYKLGVNYQF